MVKYVFQLRVVGSPDEYSYELNLQPTQEDTPETIFTPEVQASIRQALQEKSLCAIKDVHLNQIVSTWINDIKEGYRTSGKTMALPLLMESNLEQLEDKGNQELPLIITPDLSTLEPVGGMLPSLVFT